MIKITYLLLILVTFLSACSHETHHQAQGYIEGRYTYIASSVSGTLEHLAVTKGAFVKQGQLLVSLEEKPESDAYKQALQTVNEAIASRDSIAANLVYAKLTFERNSILVPKKALQESELDSARASYQSTIAQLAQANANITASQDALAQAEWNKNEKIQYAPTDAIVFDTYYREGERTVANTSILSLIAPENIKAIFYVPEVDLGAIKLGDKVSVRCDSCAQEYIGRISFISPSAEYTPPVIYSMETTAKLIYRVEAEFDRQDAYQLHPGQPVIVKYHE